MLITFTSKSSAPVLMYKDHAKRILDLLHKDAEIGVITAAEAPKAIAILEGEITESKLHAVTAEVQRDIDAHHGEQGDDPDHEGVEVVSFSSRAYPLLEMLRAAQAGGHDVLWGV
jgi:hypothetical protein